MYNGKVIAEKDGKFSVRVPGMGAEIYIRPHSPEERAVLVEALRSKEAIRLVRAPSGVFGPFVEPTKT